MPKNPGAARCEKETTSLEGDGPGVVPSLLCAHLGSMKPENEAQVKLSVADRVPGLGEGQCCPALTLGTRQCRSVDLRGQPRTQATQQASSKTHHDLCQQALRDGSPGQPGGETEKPQRFCGRSIPSASAQQELACSIWTVKAASPARALQGAEKVGCSDRGSGVWISSF